MSINQRALVKAYEYQNYGKYEESVSCLEQIVGNFHSLGLMVDQFAFTPDIIQENREMLSQAHLEKACGDKIPKSDYRKKLCLKMSKKTKQKKVKWTEEEQNKFLEGIQTFGTNGK